MTKVRVLVLLAVVALLLFPAIAQAQGGLQLPCRFYGDVTIEGDPAPDGTVITATVGGTEYTASTPAGGYGTGTYEILISPGEGVNYSEGSLVTFKVGEVQVTQTESWESGGNVEVDLSYGEGVQEGGLITTVVINTLASGATATASYDSATGTLTLGIPAGPAGAAGAAGATGAQGEPGEDAPGGIVLPIIALVLAVIAIGVAVMGMRRRV